MRKEFYIFSVLACVGLALAATFEPRFWRGFFVLGPVILLGIQDVLQSRHTIRKNFPILGRFRYLFEMIRPEINQYFVESNTDGTPFSREQRSLVYQRSKKVLDTLPFGTKKDVYQVGYEWVNHSLAAKHVDPKSMRIVVGSKHCRQPYDASIFNISAMSYGALSQTAIMALNAGARDGNFAHNTGEGGFSPYHNEPGGDIIWQIGTGYFGCRNHDGSFNGEAFAQTAQKPNIKMIELKLSQGAKPGHGGILPAAKVTEEISRIRMVPMGHDVISPPIHREFSTPIEMMQFIQKLRELSGGKPVGIKLCIGKRREFFALCKAMLETGLYPDYISVDGAEGGTGAAPIEFSNHIGTPTTEGLILVHNALVGVGLRDDIRVFAAGKVTSGFGMVKLLAIGADAVYAARGFMLSLGCIQALRCNENVCPAGVATQDPILSKGLVVQDKRTRVKNFHFETVESVAEIIGAMGLSHPQELRPWHICRRVSPTEVKHYGEMFNFVKKGQLLGKDIPDEFVRAWEAANAATFQHNGDLRGLH